MVAAASHLLVVTLLVVFVTQTAGWQGVLGRVEMETQISQRYSATHCRLTLHNPHPRPAHLTLNLLLPAHAYVSSLTIETRGRNITTTVKEKRKTTTTTTTTAAAAGSAANQGSRSKALIKETQRFKASIKVASMDQATFYIAYEQLLQRAQGRYTYTLYLPPYTGTGTQNVKVKIREKEEIKNLRLLQKPSPPAVREELLKSNEVVLTYQRGGGGGGAAADATNATTSNPGNTHRSIGEVRSKTYTSEQGNVTSERLTSRGSGDVLTLCYDVQRPVDGGEVQVLGRFFVHYLSPEGLPKLPAHTVFALDVSGSMSDHGKLDQLKKAIIAIIRGMPEEDSFEVLVFSTRVRSLGVYQALPHHVEEGVAKIQALRALGGTNINDALLQAVRGANTHNSTHAPARQVVFLTDGKPNIGETKPDQLRRNVREANLHQLPVFSLALGRDADVRLLRQVSGDNEGFTQAIEEGKETGEQLQEFYSGIAKPLMTDVDVMYRDDVVDRNSIIRHGPSNFYSGSEVVYAGQLREGVKEVHPIVAGRGKDGPLQLRVSRTHTSEPDLATDNHVERLWAYLSVQDLLDAVDIVDDRNLRVEMRDRVKEIAVKYQFVTKLTSLTTEESEISDTHPGLKSGSTPHKSREGTEGGLMGQDLALLSPSAIAETFPAPLSNRIYKESPSTVSFGDNDPHFVVQVPGMSLPFCFDIHATTGSFLSLIHDPHSGVLVNGQVTGAVGRPGNTYFTSIFISLTGVNFTITTTHVTVSCLDHHGNPTVDNVVSSLWPLTKRKANRRRHKRRKEPRSKRKSHRRRGRRFRGAASRRKRHHTAGPRRHYTKDMPKRRERRNLYSGVPHGLYPKNFRKRRRSRPRPYPFYPETQDFTRTSYGDPSQAQTIQRASTYTPLNIFKRMVVRSHMPSHHIPTHRSQRTTRLQYQNIQESYPFRTRISRPVRELPRRPVFHPQAGAFLHPQAHVDMSVPRIVYSSKPGRGEDERRREERESHRLYRECSKTLTWKKMTARRYGDVVVMLRNRRKLVFQVGDVALSLVVTRSRTAHQQHFLGVYLEKQTLLSPNTTGIIGQFVYKTVGTVGETVGRPVTPPVAGSRRNNTSPRVRLAVVQPGPQRTYQVSEVNAILSSRRSLLHKTHISCLFIKDQGRGLVAGTPQDYLRPCLSC